MGRLQKQVVVTGLLLIAAGFLFGLVMTFAADHQTRLLVNDSYSEVFVLLSRDGSSNESKAIQDEADRKALSYSRAVGFHTHSINMGILVILGGLLLPLVGAHGRRRTLTIYGFVFAACLYPIGLLLTLFGLELVGEIAAAAGAILAIATFAVIWLGISQALSGVKS